MQTIKPSNLIPCLNLGAGGQPIPNAINVDMYPGPLIDQVVDLNKPWPWADNSVYHIFSSHTVEHLDDVVHFMREANRVLAVGGTMELRLPYGWDTAGMADPTHKRPMYPQTFTAFSLNTVSKTDPRRFNFQEAHSRWDFGFEIDAITYIFRDWVKKLPFWRLYGFNLAMVLINVIQAFNIKFRKVK